MQHQLVDWYSSLSLSQAGCVTTLHRRYIEEEKFLDRKEQTDSQVE